MSPGPSIANRRGVRRYGARAAWGAISRSMDWPSGSVVVSALGKYGPVYLNMNRMAYSVRAYVPETLERGGRVLAQRRSRRDILFQIRNGPWIGQTTVGGYYTYLWPDRLVLLTNHSPPQPPSRQASYTSRSCFVPAVTRWWKQWRLSLTGAFFSLCGAPSFD
jgi:hypothetical protein